MRTSGSCDNEHLHFEFAADGVNFVHAIYVTTATTADTQLMFLPTNVPFTANAAIRFTAVNSPDLGKSFSINNLVVTANRQ